MKGGRGLQREGARATEREGRREGEEGRHPTFDPIDNKPSNRSILSDLSQGSHGIRAFATTPWKYKAYAVHNTVCMIVNNSRGFAIYHARLQA